VRRQLAMAEEAPNKGAPVWASSECCQCARPTGAAHGPPGALTCGAAGVSAAAYVGGVPDQIGARAAVGASPFHAAVATTRLALLPWRAGRTVWQHGRVTLPCCRDALANVQAELGRRKHAPRQVTAPWSPRDRLQTHVHTNGQRTHRELFYCFPTSAILVGILLRGGAPGRKDSKEGWGLLGFCWGLRFVGDPCGSAQRIPFEPSLVTVVQGHAFLATRSDYHFPTTT